MPRAADRLFQPLDQIVSDYGAIGLFLGAGLEGDGVAMLGGILAHRQLVDVGTAVLAVAGGSLMVDQVFFQLGRRFRDHHRVRIIQASTAGVRVLRAFEKRPDAFVFAFRFLYGLRIASAVIIGTTTFPARRFIILNALAALVWASIFVTIGYLCGQAIEGMFGRLHAKSHYILAGMAILLFVILIAVVSRRSRADRR